MVRSSQASITLTRTLWPFRRGSRGLAAVVKRSLAEFLASVSHVVLGDLPELAQQQEQLEKEVSNMQESIILCRMWPRPNSCLM